MHLWVCTIKEDRFLSLPFWGSHILVKRWWAYLWDYITKVIVKINILSCTKTKILWNEISGRTQTDKQMKNIWQGTEGLSCMGWLKIKGHGLRVFGNKSAVWDANLVLLWSGQDGIRQVWDLWERVAVKESLHSGG